MTGAPTLYDRGEIAVAAALKGPLHEFKQQS
jgi:hypothetical protein